MNKLNEYSLWWAYGFEEEEWFCLNKTLLKLGGERKETNKGRAVRDSLIDRNDLVRCKTWSHYRVSLGKLDQITPAKNKAIADQIINTGGCLLSEYPIGSEFNRSNYIERNRLQVALGLGLIIVETSRKSGSMSTVNYAKKFDKQIACIDHDESFHHIESVQGNRLLINDGVHPIKDSKELHAFLKIITKGCKVIKSQNQLEL